MKKMFLIILLLVSLGIASAGYTTWRAMQGEPADALEEIYFLDTDRFLQVDGALIRVREEGPRDGPPILLIHGFTHSLETWDGWAAQLKSTYRVIRYDLLGHGLTGPDPQERYGPIERARFIGDVMDAIDLTDTVIAGNSLGGLAAWRFASMNPDRVNSLILISPGAYSLNGVSDEPAPIPSMMRAYLLTATEAGVRASAQFIYADDSKITPARLKTMRDMMRRDGNGEAMIKSLEEFTLPDPTSALATITVPTLIQWGEGDIVIPIAQGQRLVSDINGAQLIAYPGVGHAAQEEAPQETVADAIEFLNQTSNAVAP